MGYTFKAFSSERLTEGEAWLLELPERVFGRELLPEVVDACTLQLDGAPLTFLLAAPSGLIYGELAAGLWEDSPRGSVECYGWASVTGVRLYGTDVQIELVTRERKSVDHYSLSSPEATYGEALSFYQTLAHFKLSAAC